MERQRFYLNAADINDEFVADALEANGINPSDITKPKRRKLMALLCYINGIEKRTDNGGFFAENDYLAEMAGYGCKNNLIAALTSLVNEGYITRKSGVRGKASEYVITTKNKGIVSDNVAPKNNTLFLEKQYPISKNNTPDIDIDKEIDKEKEINKEKNYNFKNFEKEEINKEEKAEDKPLSGDGDVAEQHNTPATTQEGHVAGETEAKANTTPANGESGGDMGETQSKDNGTPAEGKQAQVYALPCDNPVIPEKKVNFYEMSKTPVSRNRMLSLKWLATATSASSFKPSSKFRLAVEGEADNYTPESFPQFAQEFGKVANVLFSAVPDWHSAHSVALDYYLFKVAANDLLSEDNANVAISFAKRKFKRFADRVFQTTPANRKAEVKAAITRNMIGDNPVLEKLED